MIEWIEKLPDSLTGIVLSGAVWFGFNYLVLAERAMEKAHAEIVVPHCVEVLEGHQRTLRPPVLGLDRLFGMRGLDELQSRVTELTMPRPLTAAEQVQRCGCAATRAAAEARFDYAIHTASFRLIKPASVAALRDQTVDVVLRGACGLLPQIGR